MCCRLDYTYEGKNQLLIRKFSGTLKISDSINSWIETIDEHILKKDIKGIVSDYSNTDIQINVTEIDPMGELFLDHINTLKYLKIAQVVDSPQIILPMVFKSKHNEFQIWPFTTLEAAIEWALQ